MLMSRKDEYLVVIDSDIKELIPDFLAGRRLDADALANAAATANYHEVKKIAHRIKGSGGSYGFACIHEFGKKIGTAAGEENQKQLIELVESLVDYLENIEIEYR
jgi:HPt (histidine-containing phosphotransfer) domain-containing protein